SPAGSLPSANASRWVPSATATASNAGPTLADDAGTRTRQPSRTWISLARLRGAAAGLPPNATTRQVPSLHDVASRRGLREAAVRPLRLLRARGRDVHLRLVGAHGVARHPGGRRRARGRAVRPARAGVAAPRGLGARG